MKTNRLLRIRKFFEKMLFLLFLLLTFNFVNSQDAGYKVAEQVALNAYALHSGVARSEISINEVIPIKAEYEIAFFIFTFRKHGYIIISNELNATPVLGYGLESNIELEKVPLGLSYLLNNYTAEIAEKKNKNWPQPTPSKRCGTITWSWMIIQPQRVTPLIQS